GTITSSRRSSRAGPKRASLLTLSSTQASCAGPQLRTERTSSLRSSTAPTSARCSSGSQEVAPCTTPVAMRSTLAASRARPLALAIVALPRSPRAAAANWVASEDCIPCLVAIPSRRARYSLASSEKKSSSLPGDVISAFSNSPAKGGQPSAHSQNLVTLRRASSAHGFVHLLHCPLEADEHGPADDRVADVQLLDLGNAGDRCDISHG